jgi:hypothetical protein
MSLEGMAPMSDSVSASASVVSERPIDVGWVGGWATDFEKLLTDNIGLMVFAVINRRKFFNFSLINNTLIQLLIEKKTITQQDFLRKEFSYENLQFWISCQQFKKLTHQQEVNHIQLIFSNSDYTENIIPSDET